MTLYGDFLKKFKCQKEFEILKMPIEISFIITVFNKEKYLPATICSLLRQTEQLNSEYIFVDDASSDASIQTIEEIFSNGHNLTVLKNQTNRGPAICLNQGCAAASGKYLFLMDADDILAKNSLKIMLNAIKKEKADFVFGNYKVTHNEQKELLDVYLDDNIDYEVSNSPLESVLKGGYVRMAYLTTKELYVKSGGSNQKLFIQDESLPLRLAYHAKKIIKLKIPAVYAGRNDDSLSKNKTQQIHDRFYSYYFSLLEFDQLNVSQKSKIFKKALSSVWKAKRISGGLGNYLFFFVYLKSRVFFPNPEIKFLNKYKSFIDSLKNVRKIS
jgi:glycosyltransferase involved in cell wall biosynthesis